MVNNKSVIYLLLCYEYTVTSLGNHMNTGSQLMNTGDNHIN